MTVEGQRYLEECRKVLKEEQKEIRERLREEAKLQKEIEEERKKVQKEQTHYQNALSQIEDQLKSDPENEELLKKKESE